MKKTASLFLSIMLAICSCFCLTACGEELTNYDINVNVWYVNYGFVEGAGSFEEGSKCTIKATPKNDSKFIAWMKNDIIESYDAEYTFDVSLKTSGTYTAIFTCPALELVTPTSIEYNDKYEDANKITNIKAIFKLGSSYNNLKEVFNDNIQTINTFDIDKITLALNKKTAIYGEALLEYTYPTIIDNEETEITVKTQTYFEINLHENNILKEPIKLNLPKEINGEATLSFTFEELKAKENTNKDNK